MWKNEIIKQIFFDIIPLKNKNVTFTVKSLDYLRTTLLSATVYYCGSSESITELSQSDKEKRRASFFNEEGLILPLPQASMLLEYFTPAHERRAVLLTDRHQCGVEMYVFRFQKETNRWRWPFIGMAYGPTFHENARISIYEPTILASLKQSTQAAMIREHATDTGPALQCLDLVRRRLLSPECEAGPSAQELAAQKAEHVASPRPSSFARASRNRHMTGQVGKGARRS